MKKVVTVGADTAAASDEVSMNIADIGDVRPSRRKSDYQGVAQLAASMAVEGLRHPILVMPNGNILKGGRRLAAANALGWTTIQVREVRYLEDAVDAIIDSRDDMAVPRAIEEWVALGMTIETLDHRVKGRGDDYQTMVGTAVTTSGAKYKRGRAVVLAARSQLRPAHVVDLARQYVTAVDDGTMSVTMAYSKLRAEEKAHPADVVADDGLPTTPPPSAAARSPRARLVREEWIRALAAKGATSQQMADRLGIGVSATRKIISDVGVTVAADQALAKTQRKAADPNKAIRVAIDDLDALVWSLEKIDATQLNPAEAIAWADHLGRYARSINRVSRTIKGVTQ